MPEGILKLVRGGTTINISCLELPPRGGKGLLVIQNVERKEHKVGEEVKYEYLSIPNLQPGELPNVPPDMILKIEIQDEIQENKIVLPYNGGDPNTELSVKYKYQE